MQDKKILKVKYLGKGEFSNQKVVEIIDVEGKKYQGLFQECHMKSNSELVVKVREEGKGEFEGMVGIDLPHGQEYGIYGNGLEAYGYVIVKSTDLTPLRER